MEEEDLQTLVAVQVLIRKKPEMAYKVLECVIDGIKNYRHDTDKKASNIWLIVKNLKQKDLDRLKELIVPEVFESLGL